jgi:hypothetical protein
MWQSINNANWKSVESMIRRTAAVEGNLDVWTGGIGILRLADREIFLGRDKNDPKRLLIPAPQLLFKLVHNPLKNTALTFVTVNDPYATDPLPEVYKICHEHKICNDNFPQFKQFYEGYTYCCLYEDFMNSSTVKNLMLPVNFINVKPLNFR